MKHFLLILLSLNTQILMSQGELNISISKCERYGDTYTFRQFQLYKDSSLIKNVKVNHTPFKKFKNLEYGNYSIKFKSIFGKTEIIKFEITPKKIAEVNICIDYLNHDLIKIPTYIDQLKNDEKISLTYKAQGCFSSSSETLFISKENETYFALLNGKSKKLDQDDLEIIKKFEIELALMHLKGYCTNTENYTLN